MKPLLDAGDDWRERLLSSGGVVGPNGCGKSTPVVGDVRFAVGIRNKSLHSGSFQDWPLSTPLASYAVDLRLTAEEMGERPNTGGHLAQGAEAVALRALRTRAAETPSEGATEGWIAIDGPADNFYEVVVADVLPYENDAGIVPRIAR